MNIFDSLLNAIQSSRNLDKRKPECPYCHGALPKVPGKQTTCIHCGQYMYVRTRSRDRARVVVTQAEADNIDKEWASIRGDTYDTQGTPVMSKPKPPLAQQCPYCHKAIDLAHRDKRKCTFCGGIRYIRLLPDQGNYEVYVTEQEAHKIDYINTLKSYGYTNDDFESEKEKLTQQFKRPTRDFDVLWTLLNRAVLNHSSDFHKVSDIYFVMASFLREEGVDNFQTMRQAQKWRLKQYQHSYQSKYPDFKVIVQTGGEGSCESCRALEGKSYNIEEALKSMPLPCKDCLNKKTKTRHGYCFCLYYVRYNN